MNTHTHKFILLFAAPHSLCYAVFDSASTFAAASNSLGRPVAKAGAGGAVRVADLRSDLQDVRVIRPDAQTGASA